MTNILNYARQTSRFPEITDFHDAKELDHDPAWPFMQIGVLLVIWGALITAVMWGASQ